MNLVVLLARTGRSEEAEAEVRAWMAKTPEDAAAWYSRGVIHGVRGQHQEARAAFSRSLELDSTSLDALRGRGAAAMALADLLDAAGDFRRIVELKPRVAQARNELGLALERSGQLPAAIAEYEESLRLDPTQGPLAEYVARLRSD